MIRLALAALLLSLSVTAVAQPTRVATRQVGSARLENVPEIPADVRAAVQRYQNYRAATFQDWLPDGGMLITTRFGATNQLHRVAGPARSRLQLTFHDEPVRARRRSPAGMPSSTAATPAATNGSRSTAAASPAATPASSPSPARATSRRP